MRRGEYDKSVAYARRLLEYRRSSFHDLFKELRKMLRPEDLRVYTDNILRLSRELDIEGYMEICNDLGLSKDMLRVLEENSKKIPDRLYGLRNLDRFAYALRAEYPEEMLQYNLEKANAYISMGKRYNYQAASHYLDSAEEIDCSLLGRPESWHKRFAEILERNRKRRAFIEEYNHHKGILKGIDEEYGYP